MITLLIWRQKVHDDKTGRDFEKDKASYRSHVIDVVFSKSAKKVLEDEIEDRGLKFPIKLELDEEVDYFPKKVHYERNDGTKGEKIKVTILSWKTLEQGKFENKSLDELVDEIYSDEESESEE